MFDRIIDETFVRDFFGMKKREDGLLHFTFDPSKINDIQLAALRKVLPRLKHAHFTNLQVRINGEYETIEADWLKHFVEVKHDR